MDCDKIYFRVSENKCITSFKGLMFRKELRFLKRKSCNGCPVCDSFFEMLGYDMEDCDFQGFMKELEDCHHGDIVEGQIHWGRPDHDGECEYVITFHKVDK